MRDSGRSFLRASLLLLIGERPAHGYDLVERLEPFGLADGDAASTYRTLRALERDGSVESSWTPSDCGPARRIYRLTEAGRAELEACADALRRTRGQVDHYLLRHDAMDYARYWHQDGERAARATARRASEARVR